MISGPAIAACGSSPPSALQAESPSATGPIDSFVPPTDYNRGVGRPDVLARFQVCRSRRNLPRTTCLQKL
jgi:hypothetical protein